ncbi:cytochrome c [Methylobacter sp.]|uniref:cytochrome c n=1 Tax=Methylobacter sp. TaxID=2051955 RepID=UPI002FDEEF96
MVQKYKLIIIMLLAAILVACWPSGPRTITKLTETGSPALHAIDSNELRRLMDRMNSLMFESILTGQALDSQQREFSSRVITAAEGVDRALDGIVATLPKLNLDEGEQKTFLALAVNLRGKAHTLKAQAEARHFDDIPATLEKMNATCTSCHQLFRDFAKPGVKK